MVEEQVVRVREGQGVCVGGYLLVDVGRLHAQDHVARLRVDLGIELRVAHHLDDPLLRRNLPG